MRAFVVIVSVLALARPASGGTDVVYFGSKVEGARDKKAVTTWLDKWAPKAKPCLKDAPGLTTWTVKFDADANGKLGKPTVTSRKTGEVEAETPAPTAITTCITKALADQKLDGKASGATTIRAKFVINPG